MRKEGFLMLTLMMFFFYSNVAGIRVNLEEFCKDSLVKACTFDYVPHCGSDGITYGNKCDFCNAYITSGKSIYLTAFSKCQQSGNEV